jgi:NAD(P)-dependent dehydrogenase (short-subunit alcohol dehydrogenase family)
MGLEIARRLAGRGYDVAVTDVDEATASAAADQIGERAWSSALDVTDAEACRDAASAVVERTGSLDVWVNNAGILITGLAAAPGIVGYSASKHAAIAFSLGTAADLRRSGLPGIHISCVCPDGVWTPMINDKLDDPNDALSFSGVMLMPEQVAERVEGLLDKPKPVLTIPSWRGRFVRFFDSHPALTARLTPLLMRDALRRQRSFKKKVESGKWPPKSH